VLAVDPGRVIADLRELDALTGGPGGARRVAWTEEWQVARGLLRDRLTAIGLEPRIDEAGNLWAMIEGERARTVALGSHLDSVPNGGWLDGALGVFAGLEILRVLAGSSPPALSVALVDWADEEGARFGISLLGSSAVSGRLDAAVAGKVRDAEGVSLREAMAIHGVDIDRAALAARRREDLAAYLELHIEQGPVLAAEGLSVAAVSGTVGIERHRFSFRGRAAHAGTTPMDMRRDAGLAAAELALATERIAIGHGGLATTGALRFDPGAPTVVPAGSELTVDLRHANVAGLSRMLAETSLAAEEIAKARGCEAASELIWRTEPISFDETLVQVARQACQDVAGSDRCLLSGALHDAAEIARGVPAAMVFCASRDGISHAPQEDSDERDIALAVTVFARLASEVIGGSG
jgi:hydantoinase/carbamoylase family amidase